MNQDPASQASDAGDIKDSKGPRLCNHNIEALPSAGHLLLQARRTARASRR